MPSRQGPRLQLQLSSFQHPRVGSLSPAALIAQHAITHVAQLALPLVDGGDTPGTGGPPDVQQEKRRRRGGATGDAAHAPAHAASHATAPSGELPALPHYWVLLHVPPGDLVRDVALSLTGLFQPQDGSGAADGPPGLCGTSSSSLVVAPALPGCSHRTGALAITPDGTLRLSVPRQLYETLGLQGAASRIGGQSKGERYNITVQLGGKRFTAAPRQLPPHDSTSQPAPSSEGSGGGNLPATDCQAARVSGYHQRVVSRLNACLPRAPLLLCLERGGVAPEAVDLPCVRPTIVGAGSGGGADAAACSSSGQHQPSARRVELRVTRETVAGVRVPLLRRPVLQAVMEAGRGARHQQHGGTLRASGGGGEEEADDDAMDVDQPGSSGRTETGGGGAAVGVGSGGGGAGSDPEGLLRGLHEWLGGLAVGLSADVADGLLPASLRDHGEQTGSVHTTRWTGLVSPGSVSKLLAHARGEVEAGRAPWAALSCWGIADAPVGWAGHERAPPSGTGAAGESHYTVLVLPGGQYFTFRTLAEGEVALSLNR